MGNLEIVGPMPTVDNEQVGPVNPSTVERLTLLSKYALAEAVNSPSYQRALLLASGATIAFDLSPGNEWTTGFTGASTYGALEPNSAAELVGMSLVAGAAAGAVSGAEQAASGTLTAAAMRAFPNTFRKWDQSKTVESQDGQQNDSPDIVTALTLGTSAAVIQKNLSEDSRTFSKDVKLSLKASALIGGVNTALVGGLSATGYALTEAGNGNIADNVEQIAKNPLTYIAIFGLIKANQFIKSRRSVAESTELVIKTNEANAHGPQIEGMSKEEVSAALKDRDTLSFKNEQGNLVPLLVPLKYNAEYNQQYFENHAKAQDVSNVYFYTGLDTESAFSESAVASIRAKIHGLEGRTLLVSDELESPDAQDTKISRFLSRFSIEGEQTTFVDSRNDSDAAVYHYAGYGEQIKTPEKVYGSMTEAFKSLKAQNPEEHNTRNGVMLLDGQEISTEETDALWEMYCEQFDQLISENPSMQKQTKEDFIATVTNESTYASVKYKDGKPVCLAYFVTDIDNVYWLRSEYYKDQYPDNPVWYFPGIASDIKSKGSAHSLDVVGLLTKLSNMTATNPVITFQSTNISKDYIPAIVEGVINGTETSRISLRQIAKYSYNGAVISPAQHGSDARN